MKSYHHRTYSCHLKGLLPSKKKIEAIKQKKENN